MTEVELIFYLAGGFFIFGLIDQVGRFLFERER